MWFCDSPLEILDFDKEAIKSINSVNNMSKFSELSWFYYSPT